MRRDPIPYLIAFLSGMLLYAACGTGCGGRLLVRTCAGEGVYCPASDVCCTGGSVCAPTPDACGGEPCCLPRSPGSAGSASQGFDEEPPPAPTSTGGPPSVWRAPQPPSRQQ